MLRIFPHFQIARQLPHGRKSPGQVSRDLRLYLALQYPVPLVGSPISSWAMRSGSPELLRLTTQKLPSANSLSLLKWLVLLHIPEWFLLATASVSSSIMGKGLKKKNSFYFYGLKAPSFIPPRDSAKTVATFAAACM